MASGYRELSQEAAWCVQARSSWPLASLEETDRIYHSRKPALLPPSPQGCIGLKVCDSAGGRQVDPEPSSG